MNLKKFIKNDTYLFIFIFSLLSIILRIPYTSKILYCWDSVQFALAMENFNVSIYQPHPPGYILYVAIAKLVNLFFKNANLSLNFVSILFGTLSIIFIFLLAQKMYNTKVGISASVFLLVSPLLWFNSEIALPYTAECFFSVLVAYICYLSIYNKKYVLYSTIFLGIGFGIRQNLLLFLFPLWLFCTVAKINSSGCDNKIQIKMQLRYVLIFLPLLVFISSLLFLIMSYFSGGISSYNSALKHQTLYVMKFSIFQSGIQGFLQNTSKVINSIFFGGLCFVSFLLIPYLYNLRFKNFRFKNIHFQFFLLWILPSFLFYCFIFIDPPAYILTFLPALFIIFGVMLYKIEKDISLFIQEKKNLVFVISLTIITIINSIVFVLFFPKVIKKNNNDFIAKQKDIQNYFSPEQTIIITSFKRGGGPTPNYFRHFMYYLPQYRTYFLPEIENVDKHKTALVAFNKITKPLKYKKVSNKYIVEIAGDIKYIIIGDDYLKKYCKVKIERTKLAIYYTTKNNNNLIFGEKYLLF